MDDLAALDPHMRGSQQPGDDAVVELAVRQYGVVARRQLLELGLGRRAIDHRIAVQRLHRVHQGVYAVGHPVLETHGRLMAAVLACGPEALLSHRDAGWLWALKPPSLTAVEVTVPGASRRSRPGIVIHRVRELPDEDRAVRDGIPTTTLARTLLDLAEVLRPRQLERVVEEAERLRLFDLRAVEDLCARSRGRRGLRALRALLAKAYPALPTRSELEALFLALCREAGLPAPLVNVILHGYEVDVLWPDERLVVELDGYAFHGDRAAFERDRVRDAALQLAGYRVLRVTHRRLEAEPAAVVETVRVLLGRRASGSGRSSYWPSPV